MQTHEVFKAAIISIRTWEIKLEEEGILKKKPVRRSFKKLDPEKVKVCFAEQPDAYLREAAEEFGCCETTVTYAYRR
ncbi:MAG: hypothetical protein IJ859_07175 [Synergistaceae bacterium]|nr:hypothetical protein [Synergistaceae bacterium]